MTTPVTEQGMGLYQQFWAIKKRYVAVLLPVHHPAVGGNDWDLLSATTLASPQRTSLFDEEDTAEDTGDEVAVQLPGGSGLQCHGVQ